MRPPNPLSPRVVEMLRDKVGYLGGRRVEFTAGEIYELDETLFKAFVHDLRIARSCEPPPALVPPALAGVPPSFSKTAESDGEPAAPAPAPAAGMTARRPSGRPKKR